MAKFLNVKTKFSYTGADGREYRMKVATGDMDTLDESYRTFVETVLLGETPPPPQSIKGSVVLPRADAKNLVAEREPTQQYNQLASVLADELTFAYPIKAQETNKIELKARKARKAREDQDGPIDRLEAALANGNG